MEVQKEEKNNEKDLKTEIKNNDTENSTLNNIVKTEFNNQKNDEEKNIKENKKEEITKHNNENKKEIKEEERKKEKKTLNENKEKKVEIKNRKFIEEIFEFSEEIKDLIPKLKENSENIIKEFFTYLKEYSNKKSENNEKENIELISYNFIRLKDIFTKSTEIAEIIQFDEKYYDNEDKENGMIGILYDLYINPSFQTIKTILEEIFNILKKKDILSKKEITVIFKKIAKEYYWEDKNNNKDFTNFIKYIDLLHFFISGKDDLNQFNYFSFDLKKCDGINLDLKEPKIINENNTLNFQIIFLIRDYHKNKNTKIISIDLCESKLELILNSTNINLLIDQKEKKNINFNIEENKWYKMNFSLVHCIDEKIITIGICELNKNKYETQIISTIFEGKKFQINKAKFFENFQGYFTTITCYFFDYPRITFEEKINSKNIFNLGNDVYWNNSVYEKKEDSELIANNQFKYNIYLIGGMNIFLPLFEKILLNNNEKEILKKLLNLIKEVLIFKPLNVINTHITKFFKIVSLFILNLDLSYFNDEIFSDFLFELSDNLLEQTQKTDKIINKKLNHIYLQSFYSYIFFKYEIIIKIFQNNLDKYFDYLNKNKDKLYEYMRFKVCGKFLNEIKDENQCFLFIKMLIKEMINSKTENMNDIIYYLFKNNINESYTKSILKSLIEELSNTRNPNPNINMEFFINLSRIKVNKTEIKLLIIQLFQIIYLRYNQIIKQIFPNKKFIGLKNQIVNFILVHFFESNVIIKNNDENKNDLKENVKNETPKGNSINHENIKEILFEIIKEYILFSINYIDSCNFNLVIPNEFSFEFYFMFIQEHLKFLVEKINYKDDIMLYTNKQIQSNLVNICIYSLLYRNLKHNENNEDILKIYFTNITDCLKILFFKIINEEINNYLCFKNQDSDKSGFNLFFPTFILFLRKISHQIQNSFQLQFIDDLITISFQKITKIDVSHYHNLLSVNIINSQIKGLKEFIDYLNQHQKIFNNNKVKNKFQVVKEYFHSLKNEKTITDMIIHLIIDNNPIEELFKLLKILTMIFTQFFLKEKNLEKNPEKKPDINVINSYYIFIYLLIDLGKYFSNLSKDKKNVLMNDLNLIYLDNMAIISYLCLKDEKNIEFTTINDIFFSSNNSEHNETKNVCNPFHLIIEKYKIESKKDFFSDYFKFHFNNQKEKNTIIVEYDNQMKLPNINQLWENIYIYNYNISNYSLYSKLKKKYIKIKKDLFSFNGIYSNTNLFYTNKKKDFKYKISNHLTENFMNPLITPIFDFNYYISDQYEYENFFYDKKKPNYIDLNIFKNQNNVDFVIPLYYEKIPCCLIKVTHHIKGFIIIRNNIFDREKIRYFEFFYSEKEDIKLNFDNEHQLCFGSFKNIDKNKQYYIKIKIEDINFLLPRKYYFYNNAVEIFTKKNKSYYFNFNVKNGQNRFLKLIDDQIMNIKRGTIHFYVNPELTQKYINLTEKWNKNEISTFTFLNLLNIFANRSLRDMTQYPVFPWILKEYKNSIDDLKPEKVPEPIKIRELNLPIAQINLDENIENLRKKNYEENFNLFFEEIDEKYKNYTMESFYNDDEIDLDNIPYYYGTHYSNPAYVSHYLNRVFPYSICAWCIQGKSFDAPDRLFINLDKSFYSCMTSRSDLREIIPQFFFLPEMFFNLNKLNFGKLQINENKNSSFYLMKKIFPNLINNNDNNVFVNDVLLPEYCNKNAYQFIAIYREILELIKKEIIEWINLVFGVYSRGENARKKKNLFMAYTYDNVMDIKLKNIKDETDSFFRLVELGLSPHQIYDKLLEEDKEQKEEENEISLEFKLSGKKINSVFEVDDKILFYTKDLSYVTFNSKNKKVIETKSQYNFGEVEKIMYILKGNFILMLMKSEKKKILLKVKGQIVNPISDEDLPDKSMILIIYIDKNEDNLYIGTENGSLIIYSINEMINKVIFSANSFLHHSKKINHINVNNELNMLITCSEDCFVNLYTLPKIELINSIYRKDIINYVFLSSSPLPSFVTFSNNKKAFDCYNLNCECINLIPTYEKIDISFDNNKKEKFCIFEKSKEANNIKINFLEERAYSYDLYNAFVFRNHKFVDYLIYRSGLFFLIRKFPFMIVSQKIAFAQTFDKCFVLESNKDFKFVKIDCSDNSINVISLNKKKIDMNLFIVLK